MTQLPLGLRITAHVSASLVLAFLVLPILAVIPASFNEARFIRLPPESYSVEWYGAFAADQEWRSALWNSFWVAAWTTVLSVVTGTAAALGLNRLPQRLNLVLMGLFLAPLIVPLVVTAVAIYRTALDVQLNSTFAGLVLSHAVLALPFVVINVGIALRAVDEAWLQAAAGLGAAPWTIFRTITLPTLAPGMLGGGVFAFITSFDEFTVSLFMVGYQTKTLPIKIWEAVRFEFTPAVAVAATVIIVLAILLFALAMAVNRQQKEART